MRLLLIDVNYRSSSTGEIVYSLYKGIADETNETAVCYGRGKLVKDKNVYKFGIDIETYFHALLARITGFNGCFSFFSTDRLMKYIKKYKPDIIHIHELHAYFVNIKPLLVYIKKNDIPLVWTFHCEYMYTGKCGHSYECMRFETECRDCPALKEYPKSIFFDKTRQMFNTKKEVMRELNVNIVTPSQWLADRVKLSFLKDKNLEVIYNGVNTDIFYYRDDTDIRNQYQIPAENKVVLYVAPDITNERKGWAWILKLSAAFRNEKITIMLVGSRTAEVRLAHNMMYLGTVEDKNMLANIYSAADVFLLCSKRETYSMTCAESLCCGTPVVGFKSGAPETVFTSEASCFIDYGDIDSLEEQILKILSQTQNKEDKLELSKWACRQYGNNNMIKSYRKLYERVLNE